MQTYGFPNQAIMDSKFARGSSFPFNILTIDWARIHEFGTHDVPNPSFLLLLLC